MQIATPALVTALCMLPAAQASETTGSGEAPDSIAASAPAAQATGQRACDGGPFQQFDFWAGDWIVRNESGKVVGRNSILPEQGGCALIERWTSSEGGTGVSLNFYDPGSGTWRQQWISPGIVLAMQGGLVDGAMVLEGPLQYVKDGRTTLLRGTWTLLPDGRVRQHFVESVDQGKTWSDWFDGYYSRP
jgi:hypothetical protein